MDQLRREFWRHASTKNLWAVEVSGRDESVLACCGPFTPRAARVIALDDLAYRRGPTVEWLRAHRGEFARYDGGDETRPVGGPRAGAASDEALDTLLSAARQLTHAEAGTAFLREAARLRFAASHNEVLERRHGWVDARRRLTSASLSLDERSIASYVLLTHTAVSMPNAYEIPVDLPYVFNPEWDRLNDYWTRSVLALPIRDARGDVIGVLQLINARDAAGTVVPFDRAAADAVARLLVEFAQRLG